jgi:hypothetical protein
MKQMILGVFLCSLSGCGSDSASNSPGASGGTGEAGAQAAGPSSACSAAREQLLGAIDSVSTGDVSVVTTAADVSTLYVGATAGGTAAAAMNPWVFVALDPAAKVEVTDISATSSSAWDLALKRPLLYTNSGDGGPGQGGAVLIDKDFEDVTADDATGATFVSEKFFDADCSPIVDVTGAVATSFSNWYDYDAEAHTLSPHAGTWLVHGATGTLFKLRVNTYYGTPEGGTGMAGGGYLIDVAAL